MTWYRLLELKHTPATEAMFALAQTGKLDMIAVVPRASYYEPIRSDLFRLAREDRTESLKYYPTSKVIMWENGATLKFFSCAMQSAQRLHGLRYEVAWVVDYSLWSPLAGVGPGEMLDAVRVGLSVAESPLPVMVVTD